MKNKSMLVDFAKSNGRKELHPFVMGIIKVVMIDNSYTDTEKVNEVEDTLLALEQVWQDDSLPWDIQREIAHAASMDREKIALANINTDRFLMEEILRSAG